MHSLLLYVWNYNIFILFHKSIFSIQKEALCNLKLYQFMKLNQLIVKIWLSYENYAAHMNYVVAGFCWSNNNERLAFMQANKDGSIVAALYASSTPTIYLWDLPTRTVIHAINSRTTFPGLRNEQVHFSFSESGNHIVMLKDTKVNSELSEKDMSIVNVKTGKLKECAFSRSDLFSKTNTSVLTFLLGLSVCCNLSVLPANQKNVKHSLAI